MVPKCPYLKFTVLLLSLGNFSNPNKMEEEVGLGMRLQAGSWLKHTHNKKLWRGTYPLGIDKLITAVTMVLVVAVQGFHGDEILLQSLLQRVTTGQCNGNV